MIAYCTGWARHSRIPKMPVTPVPEAASEVSAQTSAAAAADATGDEGLKEAQVHTKDGRLRNAHEGGQGRRKCQTLDLGIAGLKGNGERGATPGDVGGTGDGQPVGHAVLGELARSMAVYIWWIPVTTVGA